MFVLVLSVLGLAALDSVNPSVLGVTLFLLLRGGRVAVRVLVYLSAVAGTYLVLGVLLMLGLGSLPPGSLQGPVAYGVTGVLGLAVFVWSWVDSARDKRAPDRHAGKASRLPGSDRLPALFALGVVVSVLEFSTALPFLAAIGLMTTNGLAVTAWLPLLLVYVVIMVLPELVLLAVHRLLGERARARLDRWREKLSANARKSIQWILAIVGFVLAHNAIAYFAVELGWYVPNSGR
ncbi:cytochrome c biogenesis protein CcdA [Crossiella equi]|uniref:Cytochrome c biogenesis protein CcdA n=1 Tax=Crossiella equi TaxID=130796 RepID=A0ABS5AH23_9PSEU|nr:GAP family protein [Crossiella equi]MBP2475879.1 cytochrome c biogenesis protein CcdA [Crossiella equi]